MGGARGRSIVGIIGVATLLFVTLLLVTSGGLAGDVTAVAEQAGAVDSRTGRFYYGLLLDEARGVLYAAGITDNQNDILDVVDLDTVTITDTISLPLSARVLALSGDGYELAAGGILPPGVVFVDLDSREVSPPLSLPKEPVSLVYGRPGRLFAGYKPTRGVSPTIAVLDTVSDTIANTVSLTTALPGRLRLAITDDGADLYVLPALGMNPIFWMNALSDTLPLMAQTPDPVEGTLLAVTADGSRVFTDKAIWDGTLDEILATFSLPDYEPVDHMVYEPALERLYLQTPISTRVFDAVTGLQVDTYQELFDLAGFVVSPSRQRLYYVSDQGTFESLPWRHYYSYLPNLTRPYPLIYSDDFADPASGWVVEDTPAIRWSYQAGEYELLVRNQEWFAGIVDPIDLDAENYRLEVDVRQATKTDALHGIVFGWRDWGNFKLLAIVPGQGLVGLYAVEGGSWVTYQGLAPHAAAAVGTTWHHVRVEQTGGRTLAWIDGTKIVDTMTYSPSPFRVGFYMETLDQVPAVLRADNVTVRALPWEYTPSRPATPLSAPAVAGDRGPWLAPLLDPGRD